MSSLVTPSSDQYLIQIQEFFDNPPPKLEKVLSMVMDSVKRVRGDIKSAGISDRIEIRLKTPVA